MKKTFGTGVVLLFLLNTLPAMARTSGNTPADAFLETGTFVIRTNRDYKYITIKDGSTAPGNVAFIHSYVYDFNVQGWKFVPAGGGYYRIKSPTGVCLSQKRVIALSVEPEAAEDSQLWLVLENEDGFYTFVTKTGKSLSLLNIRVRDKTSIGFAAAADRTVKEQWHLIKMTEDGRREITAFRPEVNGFKFANQFAGVDASFRYGGLCGGMVYASLDYFRARKPIPSQIYLPANRTPLQSFIFNRQNDAALGTQLDKWMEMRVNPFGWRDGEFFRWGLEGSRGGRIEELRQMIDSGNPAPLGLYEGGTTDYTGYKSGDHQVLALGYAMGRYRGDLGKNKQDFKILIYNPNYPNKQLTMVPDISRDCYFQVETGDTWRTYFVDRKYSPKTPPDITALAANESEGNIRHIYVSFRTGGDDLRGGNDNVSLTVNYADGTSQIFNNVNGGARWVDNYTETVPLVLDRPVRQSDIRNFMLTVSFGGGIGGDNWNLDNFWVTNGGDITLVCANCADGAIFPLVRFTGDRRRFTIPVR